MKTNYAAGFRRRQTPQSDPIPGSTQVANSAGGFSWRVDLWSRLDRFLILGAEGGTYYIKEKDLIKQSHASILECLKQDGPRTVRRIAEVSTKGLAFKNDPAIFALALCMTHGDDQTKKAVRDELSHVCRIGTHLFHFVEYVNAMRSWSRGLRNAVADWYLTKTPEQLAYQVVKYQSRDKWSHRDVLRLAHPRSTDSSVQSIFRWVVGGVDSLGPREVKRKKISADAGGVAVSSYDDVRRHLPKLIAVCEQAKTASTKELVNLILEHNLPREVVPTEKLNELDIWDALLQKMPMTAMIRNLGKMTSIGLIKPMSAAAKHVTSCLRSESALKKSRIHPLSVLVALKVYSNGRGDKGSLTWTPVQAVCDALDSAFYLCFGNVKPINKPVLLGLDVSASMSQACAGSPLTCAEGVAALSLVTAAVEKDHLIMAFDQGIRELDVTPKMRLDEALRRTSNINGGGTDCSLPMVWALEEKVKIGGFIVLTDSETWAGNIHPAQALDRYRNALVPDAREVVVGMAANEFTIARPDDRFALDVVGFDPTVPALISNFIRDEEASSADSVDE